MLQEDKEAIIRVIPGRGDGAAAGCPYRCPRRHGDIDSGMRLIGNACPHLAPGDKSGNLKRPVRWDGCPTLVVVPQTRKCRSNRDRAHRRWGAVGARPRYRSAAPWYGGRFDPE